MFRKLFTSKQLLHNIIRSTRSTVSPVSNVNKRNVVSWVPRHNRTFLPVYSFLTVVFALSQEKQDKKMEQKAEGTSSHDVTTLVNQSDELFALGKFADSYNILLEHEKSENEEILWRLARGIYNMSKLEKDSTIKSKYIHKAFDYIDEAMKINSKHYAIHKWMAVLVDAKSQLDGIKARISTLEVFKHHLLIAMDLNPKDATSVYMLGQFCYNIADMPWYQKKIAATLFGKPPEATMEEALMYFKKAEEIEPNFYSLNLLMLGKTYIKLNKFEPARYWLQCASNYPARTEEDEEVRKEAYELLKKYPQPKSK